MKILNAFLMAPLAAALAACGSPDTDPRPSAPVEQEGGELELLEELAGEPVAVETAELVLVWLLTNPEAPALSQEEQQAASRGHFENMSRLAEAGDLLVAGPLGPPRSDPAHRGIFVFDTPDLEHASELANSDPAVQAGVFAFEAVPLQATASLRQVSALDEEMQAERLAANPDGPAFEGRSYVIAIASDAEAAEWALLPLIQEGHVLLHGPLGGERAGQLFCVLDATDLEGAQSLLQFAETDEESAVEWTLSPWYATPALERLPELAGGQ